MPEVDLNRAVEGFRNLSGLGEEVINPNAPGVAGTGPEESWGIRWQNVTTPADFYYKLVLSALYILGSLAVIILIYGGILYLSSGGDAEKAEKGKKTVIGAIVGIIVIAAAYAGYNFIIDALTGGLT